MINRGRGSGLETKDLAGRQLEDARRVGGLQARFVFVRGIPGEAATVNLGVCQRGCTRACYT